MIKSGTQKELFIVEGKSACSALNKAMDSKHQSVYAIQGKLININKHSKSTVAKNEECQKLLAHLGGDITVDYTIKKLPYSKVIVVMDPDIDGVHSSALLLSFIACYLKPIVDSGKLSLIKPPLFRLVVKGIEPVYAWSQDEHKSLQASYGEKIAAKTQFKGVAQLSVDECSRFLLNPASRRERVLV